MAKQKQTINLEKSVGSNQFPKDELPFIRPLDYDDLNQVAMKTYLDQSAKRKRPHKYPCRYDYKKQKSF